MCVPLAPTRSGYGSPSEDFELSQAPVHKTVSGDEPEQVRDTARWALPAFAPLHLS